MKDLQRQISDSSILSDSVDAAQRGVIQLRELLSIKAEDDESFPRKLSEDLQVDGDVVKVMLQMQEMAALRKRATIKQSLEECKSRIITVLEGCEEDENIPWGPNDDPATLIEEAKKSEIILPFMMHPGQKMTPAMIRKKEQSEFMCNIEQYIKSCELKMLDLQELIDWMSNFSFEVTWDEVGMSPVEVRENDESNSYRGMVLALQRAWQCARKMQQLIELLATDDRYDVISGKLPPHIAAARRKKKGILSTRKIWCSQKLRNKMDEYEKMRDKISDPNKKTQSDRRQSENLTVTISQKHVTMLVPGQESKGSQSPYKETESVLLKEISRCWKDATDDVMYYMQEAKDHRFTKKSCEQRLERAMLMLEFVCAAIEGKLIEKQQKEKLLEETQNHVTRLQEESANLTTKLVESQKATTAAQRKITKLKRQLEMINKHNQKLQARIVLLNEKTAEQKKQIEELQELPNQAEFEENLAKIEELESEVANFEGEVAEIRQELDERNMECTTLKVMLVQEKEMSASLSEDILILEEESAKAQTKIVEMEKKLSAQESNVMSLRLMVYYKDEVIRRLKQAAIDLKSSERSRRSPKQPPPSPEEEAPRKSRDSLKSESTGKLKTEKEESKVAIATGPSSDVPAEKEEAKGQQQLVTIPDGQQVSDTRLPKPSEMQGDMLRQMTDVGTRLHAAVIGKQMLQIKLTAGKRSDSIKTTKVIYVTEDYKKLKVKHETTLHEVGVTKKELNKTRNEFDYKLRQGLETERHKSVIESMKTDEELQYLCFAVRDETLKVQKEMRKFSQQLSIELDTLMGYKGQLLQEILPNTGGRAAGGLSTVVNMGLGAPMGSDPTSGDPGTFGMDPMMGGMSPMMMGQDMMGFPPQDRNMMAMGGMGMGMGQMGFGPTTGNDGGTVGGSGSKDEGKQGENINYWKSLKTVLKGNQASTEEKEKENEGITEVSEMLAKRRKAREERKRDLENSRTSMPNTESLLSNYTGNDAPGLSSTSVRPSAAPQSEERARNEVSEDTKETVESNEQAVEEVSRKQEIESSKQDPSKDEISEESQVKVDVAGNETKSEEANKEKDVDQHPEKQDGQDGVKESKGSVLKAVHLMGQQFERRGSMFERRGSMMPDDKQMTGLSVLMDRKRARLGERRRSSVIPFRPPRLSLDVRRPTIFEPPKKPPIKIRGFFGLAPAPPSDVSVKRSIKKIPEKKSKPKLPEEPEPLKQAEQFVRMISKQVSDFLGNMNVKLVEVLRKNKKEVENKVSCMEEVMMQEKIRCKAQIGAMKRERDLKASELRNAKQILIDIGFGEGPSSKIELKSSLPYDIIQRLKEAEHDLDEARNRLDNAARQHEKNASQYKNLSTSLEDKVQQVEVDNSKLKKKLKKEKEESNKLRGHLQRVLKSQKQKLFLSFRHHKHNVVLLNKDNDVGSDVKKVALSLLRRSMMYPEISLTLLIQRYCQHVRFTECQERVRRRIVEANSSSRNYILKERKPPREMKMLTTLLAGLTMKRELAKQRMQERRKRLELDRQKLYLKMALVFYRIKHEKVDMKLIQPIVLQISGKGCERSHNNTPVHMPDDRPDLCLFLPQNKFTRFPPIEESLPGEHPRGDANGLSLKGREPPRELQRLKATVPHWFPEDSLFCPFARRSGNIPPVNSHTSMTRSEHTRTGSSYPRVTPASHFRDKCHRVEIPRIMEMEIQSGLRKAKNSVLRRMRVDMVASISSSVSVGSFVSLSSGTPGSEGRHNSPVMMQAKYEKYIWQNVSSTEILPAAEDTDSLNDLFSSMRCPLPPIPTHPGRLSQEGRTSTEARLEISSPRITESRNDVSECSSLPDSPSMRSSAHTTPSIPATGFLPDINPN